MDLPLFNKVVQQLCVPELSLIFKKVVDISGKLC